jgi:hypothetical protein
MLGLGSWDAPRHGRLGGLTSHLRLIHTEAQVLTNAGPVRLEAEHEVQALLQLPGMVHYCMD